MLLRPVPLHSGIGSRRAKFFSPIFVYRLFMQTTVREEVSSFFFMVQRERLRRSRVRPSQFNNLFICVTRF